MEKLVIIGSGPAGYTAAVYAARAQLSPLVYSGSQPGGQLMLTSEVENYPGFPDGLLGPELMERMRAQAAKFGARFVDEDVVSIDLRSDPFVIEGSSKKIEAQAIIYATGASAKWLGLPNEQRLRGKGVSGCAVCDGFFFKGKNVIVVGGGDSAMEDSLFLTKFAQHVTLVHRRDRFRASKIMAQRVLSNEKISVEYNTVVSDVIGDSKVEAVVLEDVLTGRRRTVQADGLFLAIGHEPNTSLLKGQIELDEKGYIKVYDETTRTNVPGFFAAGDVRDHRYRQAVTAAGDGCKAAMDAEKYLEEKAHNEATAQSIPVSKS
ncbi:MAG: thioredoxin-disulfide reductase [Thermoprotei archaeon]